MNDWIKVTTAESWAFGANEAAVVNPACKFVPTPELERAFPKLSELLSAARCSSVTFGGDDYILYSWGASSIVRAWLSPVVDGLAHQGACPAHQKLLAEFGGIRERYNEPEGNWLLNHNEAWVAAGPQSDVSFMKDYEWVFEECGGIPIDLENHYVVAWEANGNVVICSRSSGKLLFFAPDHANPNLLPFGPCPMYSLHIHREVPDFCSWVEAIADQWLRSAG